MSKKCLVCERNNPDEAKYCKKCGTYLSETNRDKPKRKATQAEQSSVVVADIKIPFSSMVALMVKWAIASIPAIIILFVIGFAFLSALGVVGTTLK